MRNNNSLKRILAFLLEIILLVTMISIPRINFIKAEAAPQIKQVNLGSDVITTSSATWQSNGPILFFGRAPQPLNNDADATVDAMPYRILKRNGDSVLIDSANVISHQHQKLSESMQWLENSFYGNTSYFTTYETSIIKNTNLAAETYSRTDSGNTYTVTDSASTSHIFSLSYKESEEYYTKENRVKNNAHYALRSVVNNVSGVAERIGSVYSAGDLSLYDDVANIYVRMSPAMNLDMTNVAFTMYYYYNYSVFNDVYNSTDNLWELAIYDGNNSFVAQRKDTDKVSVENGAVLVITSNKSTDGKTYDGVYGLLTDSSGTVLKYGKIGGMSADESYVPISSNLALGTYSLYVFLQGEDGTSVHVSNMSKIDFEVEEVYDFSIQDLSTDPHFTVSSPGGLIQNGITKIQKVTITADDGYYFPDDYDITCEHYVESATDENDGIDVVHESDTVITISGNLKHSGAFYLHDSATETMQTMAYFDEYRNNYVCRSSSPTIKANVEFVALDSSSSFPDAEVVYSSSDESVAKIDENSGKMELLKPGKVKITATVKPTGRSKGTSITTSEITIVSKNISSTANVSFIDNDSYAYDGKNWNPRFEVKDGSTLLLEDVDYSIVYPSDCKSKGTKVFTIKFIGSYSGSTSIKGLITDAIESEEEIPEFVMPAVPFTIEGTLGENDYYTSNVVLIAPSGYYISKSSTSGFGNSISFDSSADGAVVYLKDAKTGAVSKSIAVKSLKIDNSLPVINGAVHGKTYYGKNLSVTIDEMNLKGVYINGELMNISAGNQAISLSSNNEEEEYIMLVVDEAGNESTITVVVAEEWTKDFAVPADQVVNLKKSKKYNLKEGSSWKVEGDSTSYCGGVGFYVSTPGEYVFSKE